MRQTAGHDKETHVFLHKKGHHQEYGLFVVKKGVDLVTTWANLEKFQTWMLFLFWTDSESS